MREFCSRDRAPGGIGRLRLLPRAAVADLVPQAAAAHVALEHAGLDLQKTGPEAGHQRGHAAALAIDERPEQEGIDARLGRHLQDLRRDPPEQPLAGHALAHARESRPEARLVDRRGRGLGLGRPALGILELVHPRPQQALVGAPLARRPGRALGRERVGDDSEKTEGDENRQTPHVTTLPDGGAI